MSWVKLYSTTTQVELFLKLSIFITEPIGVAHVVIAVTYFGIAWIFATIILFDSGTSFRGF